MPFAVLKSVREVSSEDPIHCAANLLMQQPGKKWTTKVSGEKSAYVILELNEPQHITGIDIGNEHSAFVEVLVGRAGCTRDDFTEILITCSFMTPTECRNSGNPNRVRFFSQEALVTTALSSKWQMVKVLCTQPFNKHVQYGLSFFKVRVAEDAKKEGTAPKCLVPEKFLLRKPSNDSNESTDEQKSKPTGFELGRFKLREDSPDSESESTGNLFNRWKKARTSDSFNDAPSTAASIRQASGAAALRRLSGNTPKPVDYHSAPPRSYNASSDDQQARDKEEPPARNRNRDLLLFGAEEDDDVGSSAKEQRLAKQIEADRERLRRESSQKSKVKDTNKKSVDQTQPAKEKAPVVPKAACKTNDTPSLRNNTENTQDHSKKRLSSPTNHPAKKPKPERLLVGSYRPFNQLLSGVVLVISGIQNPARAQLRTKAAALGARYKADWEQGCTHLICAFKNTPKYNQVRGKGKIVTRSWIEKCYDLKKYLPWRRYALDAVEAAKSESDEEILDETLKPREEDTEIEVIDDDQPSVSHARRDSRNDTLAMYDLGNDDKKQDKQPRYMSSGSDTDDEIIHLSLFAKKKNLRPNDKENCSVKCNTVLKTDIYEVSTEEEDYVKMKSAMLSKSRDFFKNFKFFICDDVSAVDKIKVNKLILKYNGHLTRDLMEAHYAVAEKTLGNCVEAERFTGKTVKTLWILECNDMEKMVPTTRYLI